MCFIPFFSVHRGLLICICAYFSDISLLSNTMDKMPCCGPKTRNFLKLQNLYNVHDVTHGNVNHVNHFNMFFNSLAELRDPRHREYPAPRRYAQSHSVVYLVKRAYKWLQGALKAVIYHFYNPSMDTIIFRDEGPIQWYNCMVFYPICSLREIRWTAMQLWLNTQLTGNNTIK